MISKTNEIPTEIEQSLLGCIFIKNQVMFEISNILQEDDFIYPVHGQIYKHCKEKILNGATASPLTLKENFLNHPDLEGQPFYLQDLAGAIISTVNVVDYAKHIRGLAERRRLVEMSESAVLALRENQDVNEIRERLISFLHTDLRQESTVKTKIDMINEVIESLQANHECYSVGIPTLDKAMAGGLYEGFTYGFAGAEKSGKTTLAQTISHNLNQSGVKHAYLAFEMGARQIEARNISREIGVNSISLLSSERKKHIPQITEKLKKTPNSTLYLDLQGYTFDQLKAEVISLVFKHKIKGFILDYWQLVGGCGTQNKADFLFEIAQWIAAFCRKNKIWSIVLCQLNRDGKVLGSAGLERACDQLYTINQTDDPYIENGRFLNMTHSRYTPTITLGNEEKAVFYINNKTGPFFDEV